MGARLFISEGGVVVAAKIQNILNSMRLSNGTIGEAAALAASAAGLSVTVDWPITALQYSGVEVITVVAVVGLTTLLYIWLTYQNHGSENTKAESDTDVEAEPSAPHPSDYTSDNPPSVWTEGNDPTTLGDSRSTEENTTNQSKSDSNPSDQTTQISREEYAFNWDTADVSMADVGGMDEIKRELKRDIILPLTEGREKAEKLNIPLPNVLFYGPPGTGKTFLAKALATELGFPFAKLSGADVQSKWINESASKINKLFSEAKQIAAEEGGAVVFIDELDSVLKARGDAANSHAEDDKVVNEFLNQLQSTAENNVLFIGATNRLNTLDEASIRYGRVEKKLHVGKPDQEAREAILRAQLRDRPHALEDKHLKALAEATEGSVAADLEAYIVQAARNCAFERGGEVLRWVDFEQG